MQSKYIKFQTPGVIPYWSSIEINHDCELGWWERLCGGSNIWAKLERDFFIARETLRGFAFEIKI